MEQTETPRLAEQIVAELGRNPDGLSDGELARRLGKWHAHVHQTCERLAHESRIVRDRSVRPILNTLVSGAASITHSSKLTPLAPSPELLDRADEYLSNLSPDARYASFDYCFNYFRGFWERDAVQQLGLPENAEQSALQLAFYLASWGMFRGRADLLQRSSHYFVQIVGAVVAAPPELWNLDVGDYDNESISLILSETVRLKRAFLGHATDTLVTKLMLGVFGCVPAFDRYFRAGLGVSSFGPKGLWKVRNFYDANADQIEAHRVATVDFSTGKPTHRRYTAAKVIDMIFFTDGLRRESDLS